MSNFRVQKWSQRLKASSAAERAADEEIITNFRQKMRAKKEASDKAQAEAQAARQAELQQERAEAFDKQHKPAARAAYLATGGSKEDFEKLWPEMREQLRQEIIAREVTRRQRSAARMTQQSF